MATAVRDNSSLFTFDVRPLKMTDEAFYEFCQRNKDFRFEMDKRKNLVVAPRSTLANNERKSEINFQLCVWAEKKETGIVFDSNGMFTLPNGAKRAPDAFWILKERYFALPQAEREERFARIAPDFVIELRSKSDRLSTLQKKMCEYIKNGVRLGWLIDTHEKKVHVYRADKTVQVFENPERVSGEDVLRGFELDLTEIW